jgi:hypothetical protein
MPAWVRAAPICARWPASISVSFSPTTYRIRPVMPGVRPIVGSGWLSGMSVVGSQPP